MCNSNINISILLVSGGPSGTLVQEQSYLDPVSNYGAQRAYFKVVAYPETFLRGCYARNFFRGGVQQIQLRTDSRENGNLGEVAP
jgi:hypothetical protein